MRSHTKFLAATAVLVAAMAIPAMAQAADAVAQNSGTLRAGPGSDFPAVDHISSGDELQVYGCTDSYSWCDVSDGDNRGWFPGSRIAYLRDGSEVILPDVGAAVGIAIIGFGVDEYWQAHYHNRPFFRQEHTWIGRYHGPGPGGPVHPINNPTPPHTPPAHITPLQTNNHIVHNNTHIVVNNNHTVQTNIHPHINNPVIHNSTPPVIHNNTPHPVGHTSAPTCLPGKCR